MKLKFLLFIIFISQGMLGFAQEIDALGIGNSRFVPVFIGGWGSCDSLRSDNEKKQFGKETPHQMFLYQQAIRYVQTINSHAQGGIEKMVLICANKWSQSGVFAQGELRLQSYTVRGQAIILDVPSAQIVNLDSHQDDVMAILHRPLSTKDQRPHLTTKLLQIAKGRPLVLFGHSYGGWIGKRIIEILAAPELYQDSKIARDRQLYDDTLTLMKSYSQFPVHTFFSLEGISAVNCRVEKSLLTGLLSMLLPKSLEKTMGCRQETKSFDDELDNYKSKHYSLSLEESTRKVTNWYNIMLRNSMLATRALPSTTPGIQNIFLNIMPFGGMRDYDKSQRHPFKNAHHMLGFAEDTWNTICELSFGDRELCQAYSPIDNKGR